MTYLNIIKILDHEMNSLIILIALSASILVLSGIILIYIIFKLKNDYKVEFLFIFIVIGEVIIFISAFLLGTIKLLLFNM
jgi:hypothetical protein